MNLSKQIREKLLAIKKESNEDIGWKLERILELIPDNHLMYDEFLKLNSRLRDIEKRRRSGGVLDQIITTEKNALREHLMEQIDICLKVQKADQPTLDSIPRDMVVDESPIDEKGRLSSILEELHWFKENLSKIEQDFYELQASIEIANSYWKLILKGTYLIVVQGTYSLKTKIEGSIPDQRVSEAIKKVVTIMFKFDFQLIIKQLGLFSTEGKSMISQYIERKDIQLTEISSKLLGAEENTSKLAEAIVEFCRIYVDTDSEIRSWLK